MRKTIYTDCPIVDDTNIIEVLRKGFEIHIQNATEMKALFEFEEGKQPIERIKTYRPDIDIHCIDNVAHEVSKFHEGYEWSNPITLIQRGIKDSGNTNEALAIAMLNEQYDIEGIKTKTQKLGKNVVIADIGYTHIDVNMEYEDGDSYFKVNVLSPFTTFIIKSSYYLDNRPMVAVSYREDDLKVKHFTCITKKSVFEISEYKINKKYMNPFGKINIVEWFMNYDGMGIFEHVIPDCRNLNLLITDMTNDIEQTMQCVWRANDVEFPTEMVKQEDGTMKEVTRKPKNGEWLQTFTTPDGKTPLVEALSIDYDYANMIENIKYRRALILQKCYVPQRNDDSGGSTGIAMQSAAGWSALDIVAESIQACQESCKMEEVKLVLEAIKLNPNVPEDSPLLKLKAMDVQPNIKRLKLSEMSTKVNSLATLLSHGINANHAIKSVNFFDDPNQVYADSKETIEQYQSSIFKNDNSQGTEEKPNSDRIMQDNSDQKENSPFVDGMETK